MAYFFVLMLCLGLANQTKHGEPASPYVVRQGQTVFWAIAPTMDSATLATLSATLAEYGVGFKPVVERNAEGQLTRLYGNVVAFGPNQSKPADTLLANRIAFPNDQRDWPTIKTIDAGHTPIPLVLLPLGFWYDPASGVHSGAIDETFPQSLRIAINRICPATLADRLFEENRKRLRQFKMSLTKGKPAFAFSLPGVDGKRIRLSDYKGKVVYLDFWAHWCGPCIGEMEAMKHVIPRVGNQPDLVILYVSIDEPKDKEKWLQALQKHTFAGTHLLANGGWKGSTARSYGIDGIPAAYLIDRSGNFYAVDLPQPSADEGKPLANLLEKALAETSAH